MPGSSRVAIDVAVIVPETIAVPARRLSHVLSADRADALRLDATHLPHLTLAQQFVERRRLDDLYTELDRLLRHEPVLPLRVSGVVEDHGTVMLLVDRVPDLQRLHEAIMEALEPFELPEGGADAFARDDDPPVRPNDVEWVRFYRERSAGTHYLPHVTLGHGDVTPAIGPLEFRADRVAVCQLGRFCTCRVVLREWLLGSRHG